MNCIYGKTFSIHCHLSFDASSQRNLLEYPHKPYITRNHSHCATPLRLIVSLPSLKFSLWAPKMHVFWNRVRISRSRSWSKVTDFGTKCVCNFLLVINSNLCPILPRFRDTACFLLRRATPSPIPPEVCCSPWTRVHLGRTSDKCSFRT